MSTRWTVIGKIVRRQRLLEGFRSAKSFADRADLNESTVLAVEKGHPVTDPTIIRIEAALGWLPGSVDRVLDGADPSILSRAAAREIVDVDLGHDLIVRIPVMGRTSEELRRAAERVAMAAGLAVLNDS